MNGIVVCKMSGSGNDFVFVDGRISPLHTWTEDQIRMVCDRRNGVGADGFGLLEPGTAADRVRFHFFNSDGGRAPMCGNGALCATRIARWLELSPRDEMILETDSGPVPSRVLPGEDELAEFELDSTGEVTQPAIERVAGEQAIHLTTAAVPHLVVLVDDAECADVAMRGRELRYHTALAPNGANVNFVSVTGKGLRVRTYERGVEGETLACATGSVACTAVLAGREQEATSPQIIVTSSGRLLTVFGTLDATGRLQKPRLRGQARLVFRAIINF